MRISSPRGLLWIAAALLLVALIAIVIWQQISSGTPQERLVSEITRELGRVETVQGRLNITLQGVTLEQELWVQRPGFLRTETEAGPSAFRGTIVVLNTEEGWVLLPCP